MGSVDSTYDFLVGDGATPTEGFTTVGTISDSGFPKISNPGIGTTSFASPYGTKLPGEIKDMGEFQIVVYADATVIPLFYDKMVAKSVGNWKISGAGDFSDIIFTAFPTALETNEFDAQNPAPIMMTITMQPSSSPTGLT